MNATTSSELSPSVLLPAIPSPLARRGKDGTVEAVENQTPVSHRRDDDCPPPYFQPQKP